MSSQPQIGRLLASLLAATAVGTVLAARDAAAQSLRPAIQGDGPLAPIKPAGRPAATPAAAVAEPEPVVAPRRRAEPEDGAIATDPEADSDDVPTGVRSAPRDGDLATAVGKIDGEVDGITEEADAYRAPDGTDAVRWDARDQADRDAFERPPAGYNPELYLAEVSAILDRRPERLYRFEPWQPRGIKLGSFTVLPDVEIGGAWLSNVFRARPAAPDQALDFRPTLRLRSDWRLHALEFKAAAARSFFDEFPTENDRGYAFEARGRLDITRRTNVEARLATEVVQEAQGTLEALRRGRARVDVDTRQADVALNQRFNRLGIQLRGTLVERAYDDVTGPGGALVSNRDRNARSHEEAVRVSWQFSPRLELFAEAARNARAFETAAPGDAIKRDSTGERWRLGASFGNNGNVLRGEVSIGWGRQRPEDRRLREVDGLIVDGNIAWRIDASNALLVKAGSELSESTETGILGGFAREGSIELRHAFLRNLIGSAGAGISRTDYRGTSLWEQEVTSSLALEYYLAPEAIAFAKVQHIEHDASVAEGHWAGDEVRFGLRLRR